MAVWKALYSLRPSLVGGCRPIQFRGRFDVHGWEIVQTIKVLSRNVQTEPRSPLETDPIVILKAELDSAGRQIQRTSIEACFG